jgi:hypothetical protein
MLIQKKKKERKEKKKKRKEIQSDLDSIQGR